MSLSAKRSKLVRNESSPYAEGAIARIKLEYFLTYDAVEFRPGPYLNIIIGPNGTGKSTIVCAICLGLAGKPSLLGRALQPMEYIKHGSDRAMIEIELFNPLGENYVIRRDIYKDNTSKWTVNGRNATQRNVEVTINNLNIQVGNLCQFLPQDKVTDFAKMTQQELLENTEKAVGPADMFEKHQKLKNAREHERELELAISRITQTLEHEQSLNARLEQDVKNYQEREKHMKVIDQLKQKRPWVEYEEKRKEHLAAKELKQSLVIQLQQARSMNAPIMKKLEMAQRRIKEVDVQIKTLAENVKEEAKFATQCHQKMEEQSDQIQELQDELMTKRQEEMTRKKRVRDLRGQIQSLEGDLANLEDKDVQPQLDFVDKRMAQINRCMSQISNETETTKMQYNNVKEELTAYQAEMKELLDIGNHRLEQLRRIHKDTYDAVHWLRANRHQFTGIIYEPVMLLLNVKDPNNAKYLESTISMNDMKAFVCENNEDMKLFMEIIRTKQKLKVNVIVAPPKPASSFQPSQPISQLRQYGFHTYLRDLFECPEVVMRYLCKNYHVHEIPVGNEYTKAHVDNVIKANPHILNFYTENHKYVVKHSKYGPVQSTRCTELRKPTIFVMNVNSDREKELKKDIENKQLALKALEADWHSLDKKFKELDLQMESLRNQKKELMIKKNQRRQLIQKINLKKDSLKRIESEAVDLEEEERVTRSRISKYLSEKCKLLVDLKLHTKKCLELSEERVRQSFLYTSLHLEQQSLEEELREQSGSLKKLESDLEKQRALVQSLHSTATSLLEAVKKTINLDKNLEVPPDLEKMFKNLPSTLEEIDAAIHEEQARADCTFQTDYSIVQEYKKREKLIKELQEDLKNQTKVLEKQRTDTENIKQEWLPPLQELISKINNNFSHFFSSMKCAGEVDLNIPENQEDYEKYGVRIKVLFRDSEQLRELTPHHQSGGERSVATVLYMMALQELTSVPFRCVDEINQGMDPQNERKVFELVVKTACSTNSSQYFLLTPKLLQDLNYTDNITILCVFNGQHLINHTEFKINKFLRRQRRLEQ